MDENKEVKKLLEVVLRKSNNGWDYVTEGLIKLGFILLDSSGSESDVGVFILGMNFQYFNLHSSHFDIYIESEYSVVLTIVTESLIICTRYLVVIL